MCLGFIGCWFIIATQDNNCPLCDTYLSTSHRTTSKARRSLRECKWPASTSASSRNSSSDATAHSAGHDLGPRPAAADSGLNRPCYVTLSSLPSHIARLVSLSHKRSGNCMRAEPDVCFQTGFRISRRRTEGDLGRELMCWACLARGDNMGRDIGSY